MNPLLVLVAVLAMLTLLRPLIVLHTLLRWRLYRTRPRIVTAEEVPDHVREGLLGAISELSALGFEPLDWVALEREPKVLLRWQARLFEPTARIYASAMFSAAPDPVVPWTVTFTTRGEDGRTVRTFAGGELPIIGHPPGTIAVAPFAPTIALQLEAHRAAVASASLVPAPLNHDESFARATDEQARFFESLVERGMLLPAGPAYRASWPIALRACRQILAGTKQLKRQRAERQRMLGVSLQPLPAIPIEEEIAAYERHLVESGGPPRSSFLIALFVVTVPLFVLAGSYWNGGAAVAALVLGIVLFHELGHYLAMRAFGYVDTTIFFIPFLGGVAAGRKDDATLSQRMIVLLAGPLPGLLLALALALVPHGKWLHEPIVLLAAINVFNLLPILPLDGGQMAHMLLFARHPKLDVGFRALAGVAMVLLGFASSPFLGVLGVLALVQLPKSLRLSTLRRRFQEARQAWPGEADARLFFRVLRTTRHEGEPFGNKVVLARAVLGQIKVDAPMRPAALFGWLGAYGSAFAMGCAAVTVAFTSLAVATPRSGAPGHVAATAPLSCSASPDAEPNETKSSGYMRLAGVGVFKTTEAASIARARLGASTPKAAFGALGPAIFAWTMLNEDDDGDLALEDTSASASAGARDLGAALRASGAQYYSRDSATPIIECTATDVASADGIADAVENYQAATRNAIPIGAPWNSAEQPTDAQILARRTFRAAAVASESTPMEFSSTWWLPFRRPTHVAKDYREKRIRRVQAALAAERANGIIDEDVARLALARFSFTPSPDERERVDGELQARLGATSPRIPAQGFLWMRVTHTGPQIRFTLTNFRPEQLETEIVPLLSWLCARACTEPRLIIESAENE